LPETKQTSADDNQKPTSWKEAPFLLMKGFLMGSADIVPGVSGGTMALIVGIYTRLIDAIRSFDYSFIKRLFTLKFRQALREVEWKFMVMLLAGMACAIFFFTKIVPLQLYMFTDPELVYGLFFGLIVGSIFVLAKAIDGFNWLHGLLIVLGTIIGFWVVTLVPTATPESSWFIFISGSIAICAMILPGISGSYILLILRKYDYILTELGKLGTPETFGSLMNLLPFGLGAIFGIVLFSRVLSWLLNRYEAQTLAILIGFLIGSLYVIWPYQDRTYSEIVTKEEVVAYNSSRAQELMGKTPNKKQPEYERLGGIVNPDAELNNLKKVKVETVKQKLIKSEPFIPYITEEGAKTDHLYSGIWGIIIGLFMVIGVDSLRAKG
jgi:putative membrane protein